MTERSLPREFLLVAACCRWPFDAEAVAAVRAATRPALDWAHVVRIVRRQRVAGLVQHALTAAAIAVPAAEAQALAADAQRIVWQNLSLAAESARLQRAFDAEGIGAVVLKGATLGQLAYGSLGLKDSRDIDLLVPAAHAADALRVLESQGYTLLPPADALNETQRGTFIQYGNEIALRRAGTVVDLHWRLTDNMRLMDGVDAFARPQTIAISDGAGLRTMEDDDLFVYLCVHGATHGWSRLKWLADLNALLARAGEGGIERFFRHAQTTGSGFCAGQALLLCESLLGRRLPAAIGAELHHSRRLEFLKAVALGVMVGPDGATEIEHRPFGSTRVALMRLLFGNGAAFYLAQGRILAVRLTDVVRYPLPRPLHFLYPLLRLPMWLWRRARRLGGDQPPSSSKRRNET